jgi:magnesium-transporting ATPase (P-type)
MREVAWHTRAADDVLRELETDLERGLTQQEAERRLERYGPNAIQRRESDPWWRVLLGQFLDPLIYILLIAAAVSLAFQEQIDAIVILVVVVLNAAIGFTQEWRARRAIEALQEMTAPKATVVRDGEEREIDGDGVVPGDVVILTAGGSVPADVRIARARDLRVDESALTGESHPVQKAEDAVEDEHAVPGDQIGMSFAGTTVVRGRGRGVVVRTGDASELGQIAEAAHAVGEVKTPVQEKMEQLAKLIGYAIAILAVIVVAGGALLGMPLDEIVRTAVALTVGAIPEALPIVLTVTLAVGVQRMAKRNAIMRSLPAVETLGSTTVVGSDKTGTLTVNRMTVSMVWAGGERHRFGRRVGGSGEDGRRAEDDDAADDERAAGDAGAADADAASSDVDVDVSEAVAEGRTAPLAMTLLAGLLANEAESLPDEEDGVGDPTETALLEAAVAAGLELGEIRESHRQIDIIPFESDRQFMATINETPSGRRIFLKGSPEAVLEHCARVLGPDGETHDLDADEGREAANALADDGYRVLGMAYGDTDSDSFDGDDPGSELVFAGLQGLEDPVRPEAVEAVAHAKQAGIRVLMLTGDHARTARAIASQLGFGEDARVEEGRNLERLSDEGIDELVREVDVYARVSPQHKLKLVEALKRQGHVVGVTGDGVNDAPALRAAHIGIAMGKIGTDAAREASQMVLADDNFASITNAIEEGRVVFANVRKVTYFLLSTGIGLVLTILSSLFAPWPLPYFAAQVLWINLVTNGLQDVALAFEGGEPGLLEEPPRDPDEGVLNRFVLWRLAWVGLLIAVGTLGVFWWMLQQDASLELARSVAMTQMVMFQFFHVLNARSLHQSFVKVPLRSNRFLFVAMALALLAHVAALHLPFMQALFDTVPLSWEHWLLVVAVGSTILVAAEIDKVFIRRRRAQRDAHRTDAERDGESDRLPSERGGR